MKYFMTGSDGFIGSHMKQRLAQNYDLGFLTVDLRCLDNFEMPRKILKQYT